MYVFAIDPGNTDSAYVLIDDNYAPVMFDKLNNTCILDDLYNIILLNDETYTAIEMVASYGMSVGQTVFDTCVWAGRFFQKMDDVDLPPKLIFRKEVKMQLCGMTKAKDANIIQALIDRFAPNTPNKGKGSKKEPGFFYGFKADVWQAYALAVTYMDILKGKNI